MAALTYYTADMVRALPDDGHRYETVHGELLVTPAPGLEHQYVVLELAARLRDYLRIHPGGQVLISPARPWISMVQYQGTPYSWYSRRFVKRS